MAMRQLHVAMDELLDAMEDRSDAIVPYFNQRTGEVSIWVDPAINEFPQLDPDDPDWVAIPRLESHEAFRVMERFVDGLDEIDVQRQLRGALQGRGAFRRFRDALAGFPDLRDRWQATQREDLLQRGLAFLAGLDIAPTYELRQRPVPVDTPIARQESRILLHHLLLLGAPNGKTELIEGRVHRCIQTTSPTQARKLFERLAREVMELQGLGYRRSLVEGLHTIDLGPFRLVIERNVVWLATEVPREVWNAFT